MDVEIVYEFPLSRLESEWRHMLDRVPHPSHYNAPEYFHEPLLAGRKPFAILAAQGSAVAGVLTGIRDGNLVTAGLPSRPQICIDPALDSNSVQDALARGLLKLPGSAELVDVYSWAWLPLAAFHRFGFRKREFRGDVVLELDKGSDGLFKQLDKKRRNNVRYAIRQGVEVTAVSSVQQLDECYSVYLEWRTANPRKKISWGKLSRELFERYYQTNSNRRLFMAKHDGRIIACTAVRFYPGGLVEYAENFSRHGSLRMKPNDLLQWRAIEWACNNGFSQYSLGGALQFHREFGGEIIPIFRYRIDRTFFRRHDLKEFARDQGRRFLVGLPQPIENAVRRWTGHERPRGD